MQGLLSSGRPCVDSYKLSVPCLDSACPGNKKAENVTVTALNVCFSALKTSDLRRQKNPCWDEVESSAEFE